MITVPSSSLPYPLSKDYPSQLKKWIKIRPWVYVGEHAKFPLETKILGTPTEIRNGTVINGPMTIKGSANVSIGKYCGIAENLYIISSNHIMDKADIGGAFSPHLDIGKGPIYIGNNVWIGDNVTILPGVAIGDGVVVGAGSVVTKDIPPFAIYAGVPAKLIRYRFSQSIINRLLTISWWHWDLATILNNKSFFKNSITSNSFKNDISLDDDSEFTALIMKNIEDAHYLSDGWGALENDYRWVERKEAGFVLKVKNSSLYKSLNVICQSYYKPQQMTVHLNGKKQNSISVSTSLETYRIPLNALASGINRFNLEFEDGFSPAIVQDSTDNRVLYCMFEKIEIE